MGRGTGVTILVSSQKIFVIFFSISFFFENFCFQKKKILTDFEFFFFNLFVFGQGIQKYKHVLSESAFVNELCPKKEFCYASKPQCLTR